ncbi:MAG: beta-galactosidase, partial [Actinomycetota bacterium]|nr:beta-galactosidase [Actinomycetota bacterium]
MWESDADLRRDLDEMVAVGAQWIRLDLNWSSIEPTRGNFSWSNTDRVLEAVASRGVKVVAILHTVPAWARAPGTDNQFYPPLDAADFANYAGRTVDRYSNRIKVWEVGNEPNTRRFWQPQPDAAAYTALLKLTYTAIKTADPGATVLSAGLSPATDAVDGSKISPATFLRRIYENGGQGSFDVVAIHPYSFPARPIDPATVNWNTFHRMPLLYDLMLRNGDGDKKLWITEFGAITGTAAGAVSETEHAAIITDAFHAMAQLPFVGGPMFIYAIRDAGTEPAEVEDNFGLLRRDFSAKASRAAYQRAAAICALTQAASLSIGDATVAEGGTGATNATFTITRSGDATGPASVRYATVDGTATAGTDFVAVAPTTIDFAAGETSKTVAISIKVDVRAEPDETFSVKLSSASGATISDDTGLGTIINDDALPSLAIDDVAVPEGNSGTTAATFTITRSGITTGASAVQYATVDGTATGGSDFVAVAPTTVSFAAGETSKTVAITVNGGLGTEADETFSVQLSSPDGAAISDATGLGTIINDDDVRTFLSVDDVSVTEGSLANSTATFTITRSGTTTGTASVQYATANGSATADSDYAGVGPASLTFAAGETTKTVAVTILADLVSEPNETVLLNLSAPSGATISDAQGVATIVDDDILLGLQETPGPATFIAVTDVLQTEGNSGTTAATFTITRTGLTKGTSSVQYATAAGTATAGSDFAGVGATIVSFAAGETVKTVTIDVIGDTVVEPRETFSVKLSSPEGATIADDTGLATIFDDDVLPTVGISDASVSEGNSGTIEAAFTVTRSGVTTGSSSVQYATAAGTATAGSDFLSVGPTALNFAAGEVTKTVTIAVNSDTVSESAEAFTVKLSSPTAATISDDTGTGTIFDDDAPATVAVSDVAMPAARDSDTWAIFSVTRSGNTAGTSSVKYATAAGTAAEGTDYVGLSPATMTFAAQERIKIVTVKVKAHDPKPGETFSLNLSSPAGAAIADGQGAAQVLPVATPPPPPVGARYNALTPARILDTRSGNGAPAVAVGPGGTVELQVTGRGGVPASGVSSVVLNVTVTHPSAPGYLTVFPTGEPRPVGASLNFVANQTVPNLVVTKVGAGGKVSLFNAAGTIQVIADVAGWYDSGAATSGARYNSLTPARILDTRSGNGAPADVLSPGATVELQVTGRGGVPASGVSAVVLNVTVTQPSTTSFLTVFPTGQARPGASNLNVVAGQTVSNVVVAKVGT